MSNSQQANTKGRTASVDRYLARPSCLAIFGFGSLIQGDAFEDLLQPLRPPPTTPMASSSSRVEEELRLCITQVRDRTDPSTADWNPSNEADVVEAQYFISEQRPAGDYMLLQMAALGNNYAIASLMEGLSGIKNHQLIKEKEEWEDSIFPGLDRILALTVREPK